MLLWEAHNDGEAFFSLLRTTATSPQSDQAWGEGSQGFPSSQKELIGL